MKAEHGYMDEVMLLLDNYISVHYPSLYKDLKDATKKDDKSLKEKFYNVMVEFWDKQ